MQKAMSCKDVAISSIKENDYANHCWCISKDKIINIRKNLDSKQESRSLWKFNKLFFSDKNFTNKNLLSKKKEILQQQARNRYHEQCGKEKAKEYHGNNKKDRRKNHE